MDPSAGGIIGFEAFEGFRLVLREGCLSPTWFAPSRHDDAAKLQLCLAYFLSPPSLPYMFLVSFDNFVGFQNFFSFSSQYIFSLLFFVYFTWLHAGRHAILPAAICVFLEHLCQVLEFASYFIGVLSERMLFQGCCLLIGLNS